jgi:hypothetical protein
VLGELEAPDRGEVVPVQLQEVGQDALLLFLDRLERHLLGST